MGARIEHCIVGGLVIYAIGYLLLESQSEEMLLASESRNVAFIGNSFQFANDLPRFMEELSQGRIKQDSVLHGSLSLVSLLQRGNGMQHKWNKSIALDANGYYDFGLCTVPQILSGYDSMLGDYEDYYYDDGKNPCFQNATYLEYTMAERKERFPTKFDFVIMNDQSSRPAYYNKQQASLQVLQETYAPLLEESGAIPILYATYGYWREDDDMDMSDFEDIPTFTSLLYEGYQNYAQALRELLPESQNPRVAPVGLAFLLIWEENPSFWETLFGEDRYHPSPSGTYLVGCILYITIYGKLPPPSRDSTSYLWSRARKMQISGDPMDLPTVDEALYLRWIAKRVAILGHVPKSIDIDIQNR